MTRNPTAVPATSAQHTGPRVTAWVLGATAFLAAAVAVIQPILAGLYLDGNVRAVLAHGVNGHALFGLIAAQLVAAVFYRTAGRGSGWPLYASVLLLSACGLQIGFGYAAWTAVHVPLGVAILGGQLGLTGWLCTAGARRARVRRGRSVDASAAETDKHDEKHNEQEGS